MSAHAVGGSPVTCSQRYHTVPTAIIAHAEQQDRWLKQSELNELTRYFKSGSMLIAIASTLAQQSEAIVSAGASRIFIWGSPMAYLEPLPNRDDLPGYAPFPQLGTAQPKEQVQSDARSYLHPVRGMVEFVRAQFAAGREPLPTGFRPINVARYGPTRMKRSMRDLVWFLRYVTYAIVAGDPSILTVNVRGLRGIIPEDVTAATVIGIRDMQWKARSYFVSNSDAVDILNYYFDTLVAEYLVEKPSHRLRLGVSNDHQGLQLPESYAIAATPRYKFVIKPGQSVTEQQHAIKAAYRQVFERDITCEYGINFADLESKVKSSEISTKEFIRQLCHSRFYRREFYEPFSISRVIELAVRHILGRGLSAIEEFQNYFDVISQRGLRALIDALIDSREYSDYFGEETVPYLRGLGYEAQECRNWGVQLDLFKFSAPVRKVPQFVTLFSGYQKPLPNQHVYGTGNDPLETQFGAIFPYQNQTHNEHPALFGTAHRRILISCRPSGVQSANSRGVDWGMVPGSWGQRILKFESVVAPSTTSGASKPPANISLATHSPTAVIRGAYRQVFGREVYEGQYLTTAETQLKGGNITVREFVRQLATSRLFRRLYWDNLYVTKAIEYAHRRLLGRPTYGRQEMEHYYNLCARRGFYALVDAILHSDEYSEVFGEDTVPYERYVTPRGFEMRSRHGLNNARVLVAASSVDHEKQQFYAQDAWASMMQQAQQWAFTRVRDRFMSHISTIDLQATPVDPTLDGGVGIQSTPEYVVTPTGSDFQVSVSSLEEESQPATVSDGSGSNES